MCRKSLRWAVLGLAVALLAPGGLFAQGMMTDYSPADPAWPFPLFNSRPYNGGLYLWGQYVMYGENNPLTHQQIAYRGFVPTNDTVAGAGTAGAIFIGSRQLALDVNQVTGPSTLQPGFEIGAGWKFRDASTVSISYMWLADAQYRAAATLAAPNYQYRSDQSDSFLTAFVFNFPPEFGGPTLKIVNPGSADLGAGAVYGIWNGATVMWEAFVQRFQQVDIKWRKPVYENENYRLSGVTGIRFAWLWERYRWFTEDTDANGLTDPGWSAEYDNVVSNRLYGAFIGCQQEWYIGKGFAAMLEAEVTGFVDGVTEQAMYGIGARGAPENKRTIHQYRFVPGFRVTPGLMWYPIEGVQISLNYDLFAFFNTVASREPVSFNYGALNPTYVDYWRWFSGFQAGMSIAF